MRKQRSWRKLHLGLDLASGEIVRSDLTKDDVGDPTVLLYLLGQFDAPVDLFLADRAYDGAPTYEVLTERFGSMIEITISPPQNAVMSPNATKDSTVRNRHIAEIATNGQMAWQKANGYNQRSRGENLPLMHAPHTLPGNAWAAGRQCLGLSKWLGCSKIKEQKPGWASGFSTR